MALHKACPAIRTDVVGKPFLVTNLLMRECLVCGQTFTSRAAAEHAKIICYPAELASATKGTAHEDR